jgi:hypothetical protein
MSPRRNWDTHNPSLASECAPPHRTGGAAHSPGGDGLGESQFRRLEKKLSTLPTLWMYLHLNFYIIKSSGLYCFLRKNYYLYGY